ncbi:MAG: zinc ribbon domain-containing protein [Clostridia bacterium]|nr:zinc ribbon domain-containing protein [Clostridia bacterium]
MYCSRCGNEVPEGVRFCSFCGQPADAVRAEPAQQQAPYPVQQQAPQQTQYPEWQQAQQQVQYPAWQQAQQWPQYPGQLPPDPGYNHGDVKPKKKKRSLKILLPIIISVVLVAAIVVGIVVLPRLQRSEGDVFSAAKSSAKRNSAESYVLDVLSAVHNTVFDSKSLTLRISEGGYTHFSGKIALGKDLLSSECYAIVEGGDYLVCLQDGVLVYGEDDDAFLEIKVTDLAKEKDRLVEIYVDSKLRDYTFLSEEAKDSYKDSQIKVLKESWGIYLSSVKNDHIDYSVFKQIAAQFLTSYSYSVRFQALDPGLPDSERADKINSSWVTATEEDFEALYSAAAEFIASGAGGAFTAEKSGSGGQKQYDITVDLDTLLNSLADYASANDTVRHLIGDEGCVWLAGNLRESAEGLKGESLRIKAIIDQKKIQSISLNDEFSISVTDIDSTKITEMDSVRSKARAADDFYMIYTADDFSDFLDEY